MCIIAHKRHQLRVKDKQDISECQRKTVSQIHHAPLCRLISLTRYLKQLPQCELFQRNSIQSGGLRYFAVFQIMSDAFDIHHPLQASIASAVTFLPVLLIDDHMAYLADQGCPAGDDLPILHKAPCDTAVSRDSQNPLVPHLRPAQKGAGDRFPAVFEKNFRISIKIFFQGIQQRNITAPLRSLRIIFYAIVGIINITCRGYPDAIHIFFCNSLLLQNSNGFLQQKLIDFSHGKTPDFNCLIIRSPDHVSAEIH